MTEHDLVLVIATASTALVITLGDLLFSIYKHRRKRVNASTLGEAGIRFSGEADARREAIRRRIAAIRAAANES